MLFSEKSQIEKAINGNARAWETLVKKHEKRIFNTSLRLTGSQDDALDLTQEVFFEVYRKLGQFQHRSSFATWVKKISYGKSIDFLRRNKVSMELDENDLVETETPYTKLVQDEKNQSVLKYLKNLPTEQRIILELKFFQGLTFQEISEETDLSTNTIKSRFYSALKKIKPKMEAQRVLRKI